MSERDFIISLFIDDELSLEEKAEFAQRCHDDPAFLAENLALLQQEKRLRADAADLPLPVHAPAPRRGYPRRFSPLGLVAASLAVIVIGLSTVILRRTDVPPKPPAPTGGPSYRFVLYEPKASRVEIAGDFTGWRKLKMERLPGSGYWELTIAVPQGDHRYTYILDGSRSITDPTALSSEADDFGGRNSILVAGSSL